MDDRPVPGRMGAAVCGAGPGEVAASSSLCSPCSCAAAGGACSRPPAASLPARHPSPTPTVRPPPRRLPGAPLRWGCGQGRDLGHSGPRGSGGPGVEVARSLPSSRAEWVSSQCPPRPWLPCDTEGRGAEADFQPHDRPELGQVGPAAPAGAECTARTAWLSVGRLSRSPGVVLQAALLRLLRGSQPSCHRLELDRGWDEPP